MDYQNRRYLSLLGVNRQIDICKPLEEEIETDYLVIGGGSAGLHAAQRLADKGCRVVLVEKNICGGGMSGRSGGFLTPDSELGLRQIESLYGEQLAKKIRQYGLEGQQRIVDNIRTHSLHCDLREQDSLLLGIGKKGEQAIRDEHTDRTAFDLDSDYIPKAELPRHITGCCYTGGVRYSKSTIKAEDNS